MRTDAWCSHPEFLPGQAWNPQTQRLEIGQKPPPTKMVGFCEHNMGCPTCGFGWGSSPDPCSQITRSDEVKP